MDRGIAQQVVGVIGTVPPFVTVLLIGHMIFIGAPGLQPISHMPACEADVEQPCNFKLWNFDGVGHSIGNVRCCPSDQTVKMSTNHGRRSLSVLRNGAINIMNGWNSGSAAGGWNKRRIQSELKARSLRCQGGWLVAHCYPRAIPPKNVPCVSL